MAQLFPTTVIGSMPRPPFVIDLFRSGSRIGENDAAWQRRMDDAVRRTVAEVGIDLGDALAAAATVPAALLGRTDRGIITPGRRADLVAFDTDLRVLRTWVAGEPIYSRTGSGS